MQKLLILTVAVVGMSAIMPDAPTADAFWQNITAGRYSISPSRIVAMSFCEPRS